MRICASHYCALTDCASSSCSGGIFRARNSWCSAFEDVNLQLFRGRTLALVGESGAGKSTLARCIALLERPTTGNITLDGTDLLALEKSQLFPIRRRIQLIFQDPASALNPQMTALEIIGEPLAIQNAGTKSERRERALLLMEQVGLDAGAAQIRSRSNSVAGNGNGWRSRVRWRWSLSC